MTKRKQQGETRQLRMHEDLLKDVIFKQAGTRDKAVLEAVMNSVDAGATRVEITADADGLLIVDDGCGFKSRDEIVANFETFGTPHEEGDATFGRYRMGRGQLFAKGVNEWRSREFRMLVDAKQSLSYRLEDAEHVDGCRIAVQWYERLLPSEEIELLRAIGKMVRYSPSSVIVNGTQVNSAPAGEKWDLETDDAYFALNRTGSLTVYNLGVLVREYPARTFGVGGRVVSKRRLDVNFARNDVMQECPVWRRIGKELRKHADKEITSSQRSTALTDAERERACHLLMLGELPAKDAMRLKLFTDVTGQHWTMRMIQSWLERSRIRAVTSAPGGDHVGDVVMQQRRAFVFAQETWARFDVADAAAFVRKFVRPEPKNRKMYDDPRTTLGQTYYQLTSSLKGWKAGKFETFSKAVDTTHVIVPESEWTPTMRVLAGTLQVAQVELLWDRGGRFERLLERKMLWGRSESADAWTDGASFVALNVNVIPPSRDMAVGNWIRLALLLHHEYCHTDSTEGGHQHGPDFFERFERTIDNVGDVVHQALIRYSLEIRAQERHLKTEEKRLLDRLAKGKGKFAEIEAQAEKNAGLNQRLAASSK